MAFDVLGSLLIDVVVNTRRATVDMRGLHAEMKNLSTGARFLTKSFLGISIASAGLSVLGRSVGAAVEMGKEAVFTYAELEEQLINIDKVAKFENFGEKQKQLLDQAKFLRIEFDQFSKIAQSAARSGARGEDLDELIDAAVKFSQVAGDLTDREAAEGLSALKNNFNFEGDVSRLASSVDILSDNFLATSGEILQSTSRLSGFASAAGIAKDELAAMVTVLLSAKATPTTIRTTIQQLFTTLARDPDKIQKSLRLTNGQMERMANSDALSKMKLFFEALNRLDTGEQFQALSDLGLGSARVGANLAIMSKKVMETKDGVDQFTLAQQLFNEELESGNSILDKFGKTSGTAAAQMREMGVLWDEIKAKFANSSAAVEGIDQIHGALIQLDKLFGEGETFRVSNSFENVTNQQQVDVIRGDLERELRKLKAQLQAAEKNRIAGLLGQGVATAFGGPFGTLIGEMTGLAAPAGETLAINKLEAVISNLERDLKLLGQREKNIQENTKAIQDQPNALQQALATAYRESFTASQGPNPFAGTVLDGNGLPLDNFRKNFDKFTEDAKEAADATERFHKGLKESKEAIAKEKEARQKMLDNAFRAGAGELGDAGRILTTIQNFEDLQEKLGGAGVFGGFALDRIRDKQLQELIDGKPFERQFKGLTQAWKDANVATEKTDKQLMEDQIRVAERIVENTGRSATAQEAMMKALDRLKAGRFKK